jgi:uncharacterized membrane protein YidH (DUF202 family)
MAMTPTPPRRRRLGYLVWSIAVAVIAIPELYAAFAHEDVAWFTTISHMTGHLERHHEWVELLVVALIVLAVYSPVKVPPQKPLPEAAPADEAQGSSVDAGRTAGGRLTLRTNKQATPADANKFDEEHASKWFVVAAIIILPAIALLTLAAVEWWPDKKSSSPVVHYHASYVLYGLLGIFWVLVPTVVALVWGKDAFPTLFRTVNNGEEWVRPWSPRGVPVGAAFAWVFAYAVLAGLVILLLHLTFYPYPSITKIINPNG